MAIDLIYNLPKQGEHDVVTAHVEIIEFDALEVGECILFGNKLVIVTNIVEENLNQGIQEEEIVIKLYKIEYYDIVSGRYSAFRNMPNNTILHRALDARLIVTDGEQSTHEFKRHRPICEVHNHYLDETEGECPTCHDRLSEEERELVDQAENELIAQAEAEDQARHEEEEQHRAEAGHETH